MAGLVLLHPLNVVFHGWLGNLWSPDFHAVLSPLNFLCRICVCPLVIMFCKVTAHHTPQNVSITVALSSVTVYYYCYYWSIFISCCLLLLLLNFRFSLLLFVDSLVIKVDRAEDEILYPNHFNCPLLRVMTKYLQQQFANTNEFIDLVRNIQKHTGNSSPI